MTVGGGRGAQDRGEKGVIAAQSLRSHSWECQNTFAAEERLCIGSQWAGALEKEDIMVIGCREGIIVKVVDNDG